MCVSSIIPNVNYKIYYTNATTNFKIKNKTTNLSQLNLHKKDYTNISFYKSCWVGFRTSVTVSLIHGMEIESATHAHRT